MPESLRPRGLQHTKLPCPSLSPGVRSNSCSLSRWCHSTNSSSAELFTSCPQPYPASGSFPMSQLAASGGQRIAASASTSVLPMNISHPHMTTGKTIALTILTFVSKVMFLFLNTLSRFVRAFLPRSKYLLISWLQSPKLLLSSYFCRLKNWGSSPF